MIGDVGKALQRIDVNVAKLRELGDEVGALERAYADAKARLAWYEQRVIDLENELANARARIP
jgi:hypothetical protein